MYEKWKSLYEEKGYTLRMIAEKFDTNHHFVRRRLVEMGVEITQSGRKRKPFSEEHKKKISMATKGRPAYWKGKKMAKILVYKNMQNHLQWDVTLDFLLQFEDIEKLKCLNRMLGRDRVSIHFNLEKYQQFIEKFYYDESFNRQFALFQNSNNKYDRPSLDHIVPLSRGGNWELENLQIISWFDNRAKADMTQEEYDEMRKKYWHDIKKQ